MANFNTTEFNSAFNDEKILKEMEQARAEREQYKKDHANDSERDELPKGEYEFKIVAIDKTQSKNGNDMVTVELVVLNGEYKNRHIWYRQLINEGWKMLRAVDFLNSLKSGVDVEFTSSEQFITTLDDVFNAVEDKMEFLIELWYTGKDGKQYPNFKVKEVYDV